MLTRKAIQDFNGFQAWVNSFAYEPLDYYDNLWRNEEGHYTLRLNVPGYGKEDITAKVSGELLTIKVADKNSFSYRLPKIYDLLSAKLSVDKGVLEIKVPRKLVESSNEVELIIN
jgi:HSP20 family molecular chaperone IbpA